MTGRERETHRARSAGSAADAGAAGPCAAPSCASPIRAGRRERAAGPARALDRAVGRGHADRLRGRGLGGGPAQHVVQHERGVLARRQVPIAASSTSSTVSCGEHDRLRELLVRGAACGVVAVERRERRVAAGDHVEARVGRDPVQPRPRTVGGQAAPRAPRSQQRVLQASSASSPERSSRVQWRCSSARCRSSALTNASVSAPRCVTVRTAAMLATAFRKGKADLASRSCAICITGIAAREPYSSRERRGPRLSAGARRRRGPAPARVRRRGRGAELQPRRDAPVSLAARAQPPDPRARAAPGLRAAAPLDPSRGADRRRQRAAGPRAPAARRPRRGDRHHAVRRRRAGQPDGDDVGAGPRTRQPPIATSRRRGPRTRRSWPNPRCRSRSACGP